MTVHLKWLWYEPKEPMICYWNSSLIKTRKKTQTIYRKHSNMKPCETIFMKKSKKYSFYKLKDVKSQTQWWQITCQKDCHLRNGLAVYELKCPYPDQARSNHGCDTCNTTCQIIYSEIIFNLLFCRSAFLHSRASCTL